jgi:hypothetical protein
MQAAFPGFPSGRLQFPRIQLRGSAGFSPASLLIPGDEDARTKVCERTKPNVEGIYSRAAVEVNGRSQRVQVGQQIVRFLLAEHASKARHHVAPVSNNVQDLLIVDRQTTLGEKLALE